MGGGCESSILLIPLDARHGQFDRYAKIEKLPPGRIRRRATAPPRKLEQGEPGPRGAAGRPIQWTVTATGHPHGALGVAAALISEDFDIRSEKPLITLATTVNG